MKYKPLPDIDLLRTIFEYDYDLNELVYKKTGAIAGCIRSNRRQLTFKHKRYQVTRFIWAVVYGIDPLDKCIDHIDGNTLNNALDNLRMVTQQENNLNVESKCYYYCKKRKRFISKFCLNGKVIQKSFIKEEDVQQFIADLEEHRPHLSRRVLHDCQN